MSEKEEREQGRGNIPSQESEPARKAPPAPPAPNAPSGSKPERKPQRKPGPSIDIGPGPGADVVATPPRRI